MNRCTPFAILLLMMAGCSPHAGTYYADVRLAPGKTESGESGYTLAEIREKVTGEQRSIVLESNGSFTWNTGSAVNKGTWRIEGGTLFLREEYYNDNYIQRALQSDRTWQVEPDGSLVNGGLYGAYGVDVVYRKP